MLQCNSSGTYVMYLDNVTLLKAYGPEVHGRSVNMLWPKYGSRVIAAGSNTYAPALDFWGNAVPATIQIGAIPYTQQIHPRTFQHDPFSLTHLKTRWKAWRKRQAMLR
jgi:hypothetical protein